MTLSLAIASTALSIWLYLVLARGAFWRASVRDDREPVPEPHSWPGLAVVMPARDEAAVIAESLRSLFNQDYPGRFSVILVDDQSRDGTVEVATRSAASAAATHRLTLLSGQVLPVGWSGKVWAMKQGIDHAQSAPESSEYLLLTDADIAFSNDALRRLVARANAGRYVLTSLMVKLRCESLPERGLIPAFVFFFQMLYPFSWVNQPDGKTAAAAGGCMLVRRDALQAAGGVEAIGGSLVDDCALATNLKAIGPIWLGLTQSARSLRSYPRFRDLRRMISRSAYYQLRYSPLLLLATVAGMALTYLAPPLLVLFGTGLPRAFGAVAWVLMAAAFQPMLRFYRVSPLWGVALPMIACVYMVFTVDSAYQHLRGRGGLWKGRVQTSTSGTR
jgi:hopene-associated glycosyltransferase HpnB